MPYLGRQRRPPPASCAGLQSRQFHANPGDAKDRGAVVADQFAREADQDRGQSHQPQALCDLPAGRVRGIATDVRRHSVADRPAADTTRPGMTSARPSALGNERRGMSWHSKRSTLQHLSAVNRRLRSPLACGEGDLPLLKAVRGAILAAKPPESGECRLNQIERALRIVAEADLADLQPWKRPKGRFRPRNDPESGECRSKSLGSKGGP